MSESDRVLGDEQLLARLAAVARTVDPVPEMAYELGRAAFSFYRIDDELAALVADSRIDAGAVRSQGSEIRLMSFQSPGISVEIEVSRELSGSSAIGQLIPASSADGGRVHLETPVGTQSTVPIDAQGRFEFAEVGDSLVRFRVEAAGVRPVTTCWVELDAPE